MRVRAVRNEEQPGRARLYLAPTRPAYSANNCLKYRFAGRVRMAPFQWGENGRAQGGGVQRTTATAGPRGGIWPFGGCTGVTVGLRESVR